MLKKDFFIILIKLFGLYFLITSVFSILPLAISYLTFEFDVYSIAMFILSVVIVIGFVFLLLFKSNFVVEKLKLEDGFSEDRIEISNFKTKKYIK